MSFRIAIVEDDARECAQLETLLAAWIQESSFPAQLDCFADGESFLSAHEKLGYQMVFMDIYLKDMDGIETARVLRQRDLAAVLVFLTCATDRMPDAFPCHAFDFLTKPLRKEALAHTLNELARLLTREKAFIQLPCGREQVPVLYDDIRHVESRSNYCLVAADQEYTCRMTFQAIQKLLLQDHRFCVINRGVLVNFDHVDAFEGPNCRMKSGAVFPLNTRKQMQLKQQLVEYRFLRRQNTAGLKQEK